MRDALTLETRGAVATLTLDRAEKRNPIAFDMWSRLPGLLADVAADDAVKVLVVRGAGDEAFLAGADLGEFDRYRADVAGARAYDAATQRAEGALATFPKPSIAMIHGFCIGGGAALALACDLRFADTKARFGIPAARLGIVFGFGATRRLVDLAGPAVARHLLFSGLPLDARRAYEVGLVDRLEAPEVLEAETLAYAELLCSRSQRSIRASKQLLLRIAAGQLGGDADTLELRDAAFDGEDYAEGVRAFLEKRPPRFA
ncbi:MAG: enoyl-CoA hydratase-related protein [Trueperaceae bacterium]|nr:enoyl-CoA hydratase-related protein [Trueperaceae bacterium]